MDKTVVIKAEDNVATCLANMTAGEIATIRIDGRETFITLQNDITFGHKVALADIPKGGKIFKFYPRATSKIIIITKPPTKPRAAISVYLSS